MPGGRSGSVRSTVALAALAFLFGAPACGGSAAPAQAPSAPAETGEPGTTTPETQQGYGQPSGGAAPSPAPAATESMDQRFAEPPAEAVGPSEGAATSLERALGELDRAERELGLAGSDCSVVCKALGSMQRATERICSLAPDTSADGRCRRARDRLGAAEGRAQRGCKC